MADRPVQATQFAREDDAEALPARNGKWWLLGAVSVSTFMLLLDVTVVNVALPDMQRTLNSSFADLQWVIDAYALSLAAFLLSAGTLADQFGRRRVFGYGLVLFTLASLLCGLAPNPLTLDLARALQGVGGAVLYAVSPAMIADNFHGRQRGIAFGISGGITGLAVAVGPLVGGVLTSVSWRWIFLLNVPIGIIVYAVVLIKVPESRAAQRQSVDWPGLFSFSAALCLLVFTLIRGQAGGWTSPPVLAGFGGSAVLLAAFCRIESRQPHPMLDLRLFTNVSFNGLSLSTLAINAAVNVALLFQIIYMQYVLGFSPFQTGVRYLPLTVTVFGAAVVAGTLSARLPARLFLGIGGIATGVGLLLISGSRLGSDWTGLLPGMVLCGFGMGLFNPARAVTAVALVPLSRAGMSSGASETFQQVGVALGVAALGSAGQARVRDTFAATIDLTDGFSSQQSESLARLASSGRLPELVSAVPAAHREAVARAASHSLIEGMHLVLNFSGGVAVLGGLIGLLLVRSRDSHRS